MEMATLPLGLLVDHVQDLDGRLPRQFVLGPGRGAEADHELAGVDLGKQLGADLRPHQPEDQPARRQIGGDDDPAQSYR